MDRNADSDERTCLVEFSPLQWKRILKLLKLLRMDEEDLDVLIARALGVYETLCIIEDTEGEVKVLDMGELKVIDLIGKTCE